MEHISRDDLASLTREAAGISGIQYMIDVDREEVETILDVAFDLKRRFAMGEPHDYLLRGQTLFMIFYNQSLRTRNSFEAGMTQMGGHAIYYNIKDSAIGKKENIHDFAQVASSGFATSSPRARVSNM